MLPLGVAAVVGISIVVLIIILVIIDVSCYFINSCGLTMIICTRVCGRSPALGKEKTAEEGERYDNLYICVTSPRTSSAFFILHISASVHDFTVF